MNKPIGVSTYQLRDALPDKLKGSLPTIEQLEIELQALGNLQSVNNQDEDP